MMSSLRVRKRNGELEPVQFDKITNRIKFLCLGVLADGSRIGVPLNDVCHTTVTQQVIARIVDKITTSELDEAAAKFCASKAKDSYQYGVLGGRILASNHQKNTISSFSTTVQYLYENKKPNGDSFPLLNRDFYKMVLCNAKKLDDMIVPDRDYNFDYFGYMTLLGGPGKPGYFQARQDNALNITETIQHMYMRLAVCFHLPQYTVYLDAPENWRRLKMVMIFDSIKATYDALSLGKYSHASPTMYNAGTHYEQLSSCFLLGIADTMDDEDWLDDDGSIPDCWTACARISKRAGGIGLGAQPIRTRGTLIAGTGGNSDGIVPLARVFDTIASYVNQGGLRPGAFALYEEPWCGDIKRFLDLKKNAGLEEERARNLFYALWIPDLFMKRLETAIKNIKNKDVTIWWSLMCPHQCPGLYETYGKEFETLYETYESEGKYIEQIDIMDLWGLILTSQKETGGPYMLYKDHVNSKNAQANLGVIRNSNLCAEIVEFSDDQEYAVCNLASTALPAFIKDNGDGSLYFDYVDLYETSKTAHRNLNTVIDINRYPHRKCRRSNLRHRPVGQGVQGWGDVLLMLDLPFEDTIDEARKITRINPDAKELNIKISEVMYYACIMASTELAEEREQGMRRLHSLWIDGKFTFTDDGLDAVLPEGNDLLDEDKLLLKFLHPIEAELDRNEYLGSYSSFIGSPAHQGKLQYHMWDREPSNPTGWADFMDWTALEARVKAHGLRNSLHRADMPTASTSQILGNVESTEPYKYAIYTRRVTAGEFVVVNKHLHKDLSKMGKWDSTIQKQIIANRGSIQKLDLPIKLKDKYRTAFEVSKRTIQIMSCDRGAWIDQTQSLNYFVSHPNNNILTNIHLGAWRMGLKTGMYYLRREPPKHPVQFTVDGGLTVSEQSSKAPEDCVSCSA
jgi:ribonucleoside-diphosphate reductase alpha subunit